MTVPQTIADYVALLESETPFTHTNIGGDGEFLTITGWTGTNSDGHVSTPEKGEALAQVILEPRLTFHGYNPGKPESAKLQDAEAWLREQSVNVPIKSPSKLEDPEYGISPINVRWVHKEIISTANVRGNWGPFLAALKKRPLFAIGPDHIAPFVEDTLGGQALTFPLAWGWERLDAIRVAVESALCLIPPDSVVTWSLGYLSKVLTWEFAPQFPAMTMIDLGACLDPYVGVLNRHGYKAPTWPAARDTNLAGVV